MKVKLPTNLLAGLLSIAFAVVIWLMIPHQIAYVSSEAARNPRFFPQMFCILTGLLGIILSVSSLVLKNEDYKTIELNIEARKLGYYLIVVFYVLGIGRLGFLPPSIVFGLISILYCRSKKPLYFISIIVFSIVLYLVFSYGLNVRFP